MKELFEGLFSSPARGMHRESGFDTLFEVMDEQSFAEADCGA
jgi:hypothetical protein